MSNDYLIAEGDIPIGLVAHLDTVASTPPELILYDDRHRVMWSPQLLGADDRAGIIGILNIISRGLLPHIILTTDEEIGCVGAFKLIGEHPSFPFNPMNFMIQLDRRGHNECVFYQCGNKDFQKVFKNKGFEKQKGTFSDISVLAPEWNCAAVNLSVGYINEHSTSEFLMLDSLDYTIDKVCEILKEHKEHNIFYPYYTKGDKRDGNKGARRKKYIN